MLGEHRFKRGAVIHDDIPRSEDGPGNVRAVGPLENRHLVTTATNIEIFGMDQSARLHDSPLGKIDGVRFAGLLKIN